MAKDNYEPYGEEWEAEIKKLPKQVIIDMLRESKTGTKDKQLLFVESQRDAERACEGIINDFESGISTKAETMKALGAYTGRIMEVFFNNCKKKFKENPQLFNNGN